MNVWELLMNLRRATKNPGMRIDTNNPGYDVLRRAESYLKYGDLVAPGWSTRQFDPEGEYRGWRPF